MPPVGRAVAVRGASEPVDFNLCLQLRVDANFADRGGLPAYADQRAGTVSANTMVVAGAMAQRPYCGGHTWVFLQYLLGFQRLGWDVLFVDQLDPETCSDDMGRPCGFEESVQRAYFRRVMKGFGLDRSSSLLCDGIGSEGLSREEVISWTRHSSMLLNVMGFLRDEAILEAAPRRVFLDIDPGYPQMWLELGLADVLSGHDQFVTIGENIGGLDCAIPTCGLTWLTTRPPIVLDRWPVSKAAGDHFTSIATWRGAYGPINYKGTTYGQRVHEFRRFKDLPVLTGAPFELALAIHPSERADLDLLGAGGWSLTDPKAVAGDPWSYRDYVRRSKAELMVAKGMYVKTRSGWFSDRSVCYLASGKPVLVQDTGIRDLLPVGDGILSFATLEEARAGVEEISGDYPRHAEAARKMAEEHFDSDRVLSHLLSDLGVD
jgi:hypothetical protein